MSKTAAADNQSVGTTDTQYRPARIFIGVDGAGDEHHYLTEQRAVVVISADGSRLWRQPLDADSPIEAWVVHIGDCRGWRNQRLYDSYGDSVDDRVRVLEDQEDE